MRSSASTATALILIMLLLVVAAGFVFLFQAELRFRDNLRTLAADNDNLRHAQAATELELTSAQATRDASAEALAAAEQDTLLLEGQLVESQQTVDQMAAEIDQLSAEVDELQSALATVEAETLSSPPTARIITPNDRAIVPLGRPVQVVLVASDAQGLSNLILRIDGQRFASYAVDGDRLYARTLSWNPPATEGDHTLAVSATNVNGITGAEHSITITVRDTEARNADILTRVEANVSELRGLEPLEPITAMVLTRDQLRDRFQADFFENYSAEEARHDVLALSAFDFVARDYDLYQAQLDLHSEGVLGFYDPETAEFVVVSDGVLLDPAAQWTHAHEFVHALQDQHYNLDFLYDDSIDSEARAAIRALAEGEAELVQYLYLFEGDYFTEEEVAAIMNNSGAADRAFLNTFPPILIKSLSFPYTSGVDFVLDLYRQGGFEAIDEAWRDPPRSTEHILHPGRYRAGDEPQLVVTVPLTETLGAGWELIDEDTLGEFYLREYLDQQLSIILARRVAEGWGGDRYAVYWNEADSALVMALRVAWDTPEDATEFGDAYPQYVEGLFGNGPHDAPGDGSRCWSGEDVVCLFIEEIESFVVRAPDMATAQAVMAAIRR
jgi:hypothetical protein